MRFYPEWPRKLICLKYECSTFSHFHVSLYLQLINIQHTHKKTVLLLCNITVEKYISLHECDFCVNLRQSALFLTQCCRKLWRTGGERERSDSLFVDDKDAVVLRRNACDGMLAGHLSLIVTVGEKRNRNCGN